MLYLVYDVSNALQINYEITLLLSESCFCGYQSKIAKRYETESKIDEKYYFAKKWIFSSGQK